MVIQAEALKKNYGDTHALRGVDLHTGGGIVGILGPNGAGKTTLVEIFEGLRTPTSGKASVLGFDPAKEPQALKQRIGVQLQTTSIPNDLTASEVMKLYASFRANRPGRRQLDALDRGRWRIRPDADGQCRRRAAG